METNEFYKIRLQQVVSYLRSQYNKKILIEDLEAHSNFSYRNLQRIFKAQYQETIGAFITRIKIENSAKVLLFSDEKIKEIANQVGFSDVYSYSKSFKKHFGISPALYRSNKESIFKKELNVATSMPFCEDRIVTLETKKVMYRSIKADYYSNEIDALWEQLIKEVSTYNFNIDKATSFGIIWDEPQISESIIYNYDACLVIDNEIQIPNKKFKIKTVPTHKYAVFTHIGSYKSIGKTYDKIFKNWLFTTDKEISENPFLEFYIKHESHTNNQNEYETEIYVPLKH